MSATALIPNKQARGGKSLHGVTETSSHFTFTSLTYSFHIRMAPSVSRVISCRLVHQQQEQHPHLLLLPLLVPAQLLPALLLLPQLPPAVPPLGACLVITAHQLVAAATTQGRTPSNSHQFSRRCTTRCSGWGPTHTQGIVGAARRSMRTWGQSRTRLCALLL